MKEPGRWFIEFLPSARRDLLALRGSILDRVRAAIRTLSDDQTPPDSVEMRGKGTGFRRLRVGSYRVIYRVQSERVTVLVIRVGHRSQVYEGFED